jgi:hypothetical protein
LSVSRSTEYDATEDITQPMIADTYVNLLRLGRKLSLIRDRAELETALDSLRVKFKNLIPSAETLIPLVNSNVCFRLDEFKRTYDSPVALDIDKELIINFSV